jgi:hypothetical protein
MTGTLLSYRSAGKETTLLVLRGCRKWLPCSEYEGREMDLKSEDGPKNQQASGVRESGACLTAGSKDLNT